MKTRRLLIGLGLGFFLLSCLAWPRDCGPGGVCAPLVADGGRRVLASAGIGLSSLLVAAWIARWAWLLADAHRRLAGFETVALPQKLAGVMAATGVGRVRCLHSPLPAAFCSGFPHLVIYVTSGLVQQLEAEGLSAVLIHEEAHRRRRDPVLKALITAAADVLFFLPLTRWLAERYVDRSELAADRAAIRSVGSRAVASALWRTAGVPNTRAAAFSGGNAALRVSQLLGDPLPRRRLALRVWAVTAAGALLAAQVAICLAGIAAAGFA